MPNVRIPHGKLPHLSFCDLFLEALNLNEPCSHSDHHWWLTDNLSDECRAYD